jgi:subtilase family serine protease
MSAGSRTAARIAVAVAVVVGLVTASAAGARTVRIGRAEHASLARLAPAVSPSLAMHVTVTLRPRDPLALDSYARAVSDPASADFRRYLSPSQFARRFGATSGAIATVRQALRARGLHPGPTSAGGLSIPVTAGAAALDRAFSISLRRVRIAGRRTAVTADAAPALSASAATAVQSIVGLDAGAAPRPLLVRPDLSGRRTALARPHVVTGGPQPCAQAQATAPGQNAYTEDEIASAYGFGGLYGLGDEGAGTTVALYELEPDDPADIAAYQACYGTRAKVSYVSVDGGAGRGAGSGEAALDIENTIGLSPAVDVLVYQGPNSNSGSPGSGPYDLFAKIIDQDRAQVVSVSWGECEEALGQSDAEDENTLFQQAAVQGQSIVSAAGDSGAEDCDAPGTVPDTRAAVDDPGSQPFVTSIGGVSLQALGPPPVESVWNNAGTPTGGILSAGSGGGGVSAFWPMPAAQSDASAPLGVRKAAAAGRACGRAGGYCREVPDVSADADPNTGYLIYWNGSGSVLGQAAGWQGIGGTSGAAPVWASVLALADSSPACGGASIGFAGPALYRAASTAYAADFHDVTTGENDYTRTNGGQFAAGAGYDLASGLGTPDATALATSLCASTLRLPVITAKLSTAHASVSLLLRARDVADQTITYTAQGLPAGLKLDSRTGQITGTPSRQGTFTVRVDARDRAGSSASTRFLWMIGGALRLAGVSLSGSGPPQLTFTVIAAHNAPPIRTLRISAPRGLALRSRRGVRVDDARHPAAKLRFSVALVRRELVITLRRPPARLRVTIGPPGLVATDGRDAHTSGSAVGSLNLRVGDTGHGISHLTAGL